MQFLILAPKDTEPLETNIMEIDSEAEKVYEQIFLIGIDS